MKLKEIKFPKNYLEKTDEPKNELIRKFFNIKKGVGSYYSKYDIIL